MGNLISQATALGYTTAGGYDRPYAAACARANVPVETREKRTARDFSRASSVFYPRKTR